MNAQDMNDVIDHLADKLKVPAEHLWGVLVRQAHLVGMVHTVLASIAILCTLVLTGTACVWIVKEEDVDGVFPAVLCGLCGLLICSLMGAWLFHGLTALYNPEYWALMKIVGGGR